MESGVGGVKRGVCSLEADVAKEKSRRSRDRRTIYLRIFTPHKGASFAACLSYRLGDLHRFAHISVHLLSAVASQVCVFFSLMRGGGVWRVKHGAASSGGGCVKYFRRLWVLRSVLRADKVSWLFYTAYSEVCAMILVKELADERAIETV